MANPWSPWSQPVLQNNPAAMMNYQQMYTTQGFNPANLSPAQLQQYQQWQAQYQAWQTQYGQKYMESVNAMQQAACNPPLPANAQPPPPPPTETIQNLTEAEKTFEKEYKSWEEQYEQWKKDNEGHPNQAQFKEYEAAWENMRKGLIVRREELRRKIAAARAEVPAQPPPSKHEEPKPQPLMPTPKADDPNQNFPPALSSTSVNTHKNDKRFGRMDGRGRGRGRGNGRFDRNPEPLMNEKQPERFENNFQGDDGNFEGPPGPMRGPEPNFNPPHGPNMPDQNQGQNFNDSNQNWGQNFDDRPRNRNDFDGPKFRRGGGNQRPEGPNNWGPNNFNEGPRIDQFNEGPMNDQFNEEGGNWGHSSFNEGPNQFADGGGNRGPNFPNNGPGNRGPNNPNNGRGRLGKRGANFGNDEPGNFGPNEPRGFRGPDGPGNNGPNQFPEGPGHHGRFPDGPRNRGPNQFPDGPRNRGPNQFPNGPGNRGPNQFPDGPRHCGPNQFPDGPRNRGPNQFPDGPRNRGPNQFPDGPRNRGPNQFPDGPRNRGPNQFPDGPRNRGPNQFPNGPGNRGPNQFPDGPGNHGPNRFPDGPGNRGPCMPNEGPGHRGPNMFPDRPNIPNDEHGMFNEGDGNYGPQNFNDGPDNQEPFLHNEGPPNWGQPNFRHNNFNDQPFHQRPGQDRPGFGGRGNQGGNPNNRPDNWQFNEGNSNRNWNDFGNENFPGFNRGRNDDMPNARDGFRDGPPAGPQNHPISPALLNKIPSLLDMPVVNKPQDSVPAIDPSEPKQLSGYVGDILAKLGVAPASPQVAPTEPPKTEKTENPALEQKQSTEPIEEEEPEPELEWKPQVFDYSNVPPAPSPVTELKFEVKDYGHTGTKKTTYDYGHGGDRSSKTFDYGHGGDRGPRSFDYGHGSRQSYDYTRDSSSASNDGYRPRFRSNRSPVRTKRSRSRSRSPRRPIRRDFKDNNPKKGFPESRQNTDASSDVKTKPAAVQAVLVEDLIHAPGRNTRPHNIVFILRGISGSGKSFVTRLIKEKEIEFCGAPPRILSIDDYFMVESDEEVKDAETGIKKKVMKYEYDEAMESVYQAALLKAFKKTISDGFFQFIIVDAMNKYAKEVDQMWSFAKQKGFQVYICEMDNDVATCFKRNIHGRTEKDVEAQAKNWENVSNQYLQLDVRSLLQSEAIDDVVMEDVDEAAAEETVKAEERADDEDEPTESHFLKSKWDDFESSGLKLDLLDGLPKKRDREPTIEEYLSTEDEWPSMETSANGKKRVRWADMEEKRQQSKIRAVGFVVGQTNWDRMMDPTFGESALTRTKYI